MTDVILSYINHRKWGELGCELTFNILTSLIAIFFISGSSSDSTNFLIATICPFSRCRHLNTTPYDPSPIFPSFSYFSIFALSPISPTCPSPKLLALKHFYLLVLPKTNQNIAQNLKKPTYHLVYYNTLFICKPNDKPSNVATSDVPK